jgi:hypothetical protein
MGFVPGLPNDVFISYTHADDAAGWVTSLHGKLEAELDMTLPHRACVRRDHDRNRNETIRAGDDIPTALQSRLYDSALLVCVVSPPYLASRYCTYERDWFAGSARQRPDLRRSVNSRIIKVVKRSDLDNSHRHLLADSKDCDFRDPSSPGGRLEWQVDSTGFGSSVSRLAIAIEGQLREMKDELPSVYLAPCSDVEEIREHLQEQLLRDQFNILPSQQIDRFFDDGAIAAALKQPPCVLSVHLFGNDYDEDSRRHAKIARDLEVPAFVWANIDPNDSVKSQKDFLDTQCGFAGYKQLVAYLDRKATLPDFVREVRAAATRAARMRATTADRHLYLICDPAYRAEQEAAQELTGAITTANTALGVWTPPDSDVAEHYERLKASRAAILYSGWTPATWFSGHYDDVRRVIRKRPGFKAGVYLRNGSEPPQTTPPVPTEMILPDLDAVRRFAQSL